MPAILGQRAASPHGLMILAACFVSTGCGDSSRVEAGQSEVVIEGAAPDQPERDACAVHAATLDGAEEVDQVLFEREPGCTVVARGARELWGDIDGIHPDPGVGMIARDGAGRFYTGCCWIAGQGQVLIWDQNGDFLRSQGRLGEGPGEFPRGWLAFFPGADDSLYVFDTNARMTVFGPSGALSRTVSSPPISPMSQFATRLTDDGTFVSVGPVWGGASEHRFHVTDVDGALVRSFGEPTDLDVMNAAVGYGSGRTFWALGDLGGEHAYVLEEWGLDGRLLRRFVRDAEWWPALRESGAILGVPRIHLDSNGHIWLTFTVRESPSDTVLRVRFEVISAGMRTVIASGAWPDVPPEVGWSGYPPFMWFISGTDLSARYLEDPETGVPVAEIYELLLQEPA